MRHLSAVPMLSTAMITVLMLSMSILIACAVTGSGPRPPEPISQPETPKDDIPPRRPRAPEIQADSPRESDAPPDLAGETPGSARMEESPPPTGAGTKPMELAPPASPREEMKSDKESLKAKAKNFFGTLVGGDVEGTFVGGPSDERGPPATGMHGGPPLDTGKHGGPARPCSHNRTSRPARWTTTNAGASTCSSPKTTMARRSTAPTSRTGR